MASPNLPPLESESSEHTEIEHTEIPAPFSRLNPDDLARITVIYEGDPSDDELGPDRSSVWQAGPSPQQGPEGASPYEDADEPTEETYPPELPGSNG